MLDTQVGVPSALPAELGILDPFDARWVGPAMLWISPEPGESPGAD